MALKPLTWHRPLAELLAQPPPEGEPHIDRAVAAYVNHDAPFLLGTSTIYERQYAQLYFARLQQMLTVFKPRVHAAWPGVERE